MKTNFKNFKFLRFGICDVEKTARMSEGQMKLDKGKRKFDGPINDCVNNNASTSSIIFFGPSFSYANIRKIDKKIIFQFEVKSGKSYLKTMTFLPFCSLNDP
jgi:hypothetical protein